MSLSLNRYNDFQVDPRIAAGMSEMGRPGDRPGGDRPGGDRPGGDRPGGRPSRPDGAGDSRPPAFGL